METKYLKINPADNVVVAISDLKAGETNHGRWSCHHFERRRARRP